MRRVGPAVSDVLLATRARRPGDRRRDALASRSPCPRASRRWRQLRRRRLGRAAPLRKYLAITRGDPPSLGLDLARSPDPGPTLRMSAIAPKSWFYRSGCAHPGFRDRCQHRRLQLHGCAIAAFAAGSRSSVAGRTEVAHEEPRRPRSSRWPFGNAWHGRLDVRRSRAGTHGRNFSLPRFRTSSEEQLTVFKLVRSLPRDDQPNAPPVAVMSYRAWHDKFASNRDLIGETLIVKGLPVALVGIAAPGFFGDTLRSDPPDIWMPLTVEPAMYPEGSLLTQWNEYSLYAIGRLRPDAQPAAVQAHVTTELQQWLPEDNNRHPLPRSC